MKGALRPTGIDVIGNIPWGTHFCHFYETEADLLSILVAFFKAGLENNEYCIWITAGHTTVEQALTALKATVPDLQDYIQKGCMEIHSQADWYLTNGKFELKNAIGSILDRLRIAIHKDFEGLRINGDQSWLNKKVWKDFISYEAALNPVIADKRLLISCTFPLDKCDAADVLDIAAVHECAIAKRNGKWVILEMPDLKKSKAQIQQKNETLERDIAERTHDLAMSVAHLQTIFDTTDIAFILLDRELRVMAYNEIAANLSELSIGPGLQTGIDVLELLDEERRAPVRKMMQTALDGTSTHYEAVYSLKDGDQEWYTVSINPVKDKQGHVIGLCLSAANITHGKLGEIERERVTDELLQRNKDLEQFAYIISHNLRAPLGNIIGLSNMIQEEGAAPEEKKALEGMLSRSAEKLDEVVTDLNHILEASRENGERKELMRLSVLLSDVLAVFQQVIEQEHIQVISDFSQADEIFTIHGYLYSIFYNLVSNSIRYRQHTRQLIIRVDVKKNGDRVLITFADNGRGIDLKTKGEHVFGLYKRFHPDTEGKGMGLFMVKSQVASLGGDIGISSEPNKGTAFLITLPAK